ncbi:hypothetical protein [Streptomyces sp. NPDC059080]|uniref:MmyB family transcriptional regulator n=1 Tax=Streptomyces sp. NPDC059080 TaxID=3346718 RepID=UPI003675B300
MRLYPAAQQRDDQVGGDQAAQCAVARVPRPPVRALLARWEPEARSLLGQFRAKAALHPEDGRYGEITEELLTDPDAARWCGRRETSAFHPAVRHFRHPVAGDLRLRYVKLAAVDHRATTCWPVFPTIGRRRRRWRRSSGEPAPLGAGSGERGAVTARPRRRAAVGPSVPETATRGNRVAGDRASGARAGKGGRRSWNRSRTWRCSFGKIREGQPPGAVHNRRQPDSHVVPAATPTPPKPPHRPR